MLAAGMIQPAGEYFHISTRWANYAHKMRYRVLRMRHGQYLCESGVVRRMAKGHCALLGRITRISVFEECLIVSQQWCGAIN